MNLKFLKIIFVARVLSPKKEFIADLTTTDDSEVFHKEIHFSLNAWLASVYSYKLLFDKSYIFFFVIIYVLFPAVVSRTAPAFRNILFSWVIFWKPFILFGLGKWDIFCNVLYSIRWSKERFPLGFKKLTISNKNVEIG